MLLSSRDVPLNCIAPFFEVRAVTGSNNLTCFCRKDRLDILHLIKQRFLNEHTAYFTQRFWLLNARLSYRFGWSQNKFICQQIIERNKFYCHVELINVIEGCREKRNELEVGVKLCKNNQFQDVQKPSKEWNNMIGLVQNEFILHKGSPIWNILLTNKYYKSDSYTASHKHNI